MLSKSVFSNATRPDTGFTLLEVLIAMVILAIGAGGVITMHLHALRLAQDSGYQARAVQFATEFAERMRAADVDAYLFASVPNADGSAPSPGFPDCHRLACDTGSMAQYTVGDWLQRLSAALPMARATVCRDHAGGNQRWDCDHNGNASVVIKIGWVARSVVSAPDDRPSLVLVTGW